MGLKEGFKKLQDVAGQAKTITEQLKNAKSTGATPTQIEASPIISIAEPEPTELVPNAAGNIVINSAGKMSLWMDSLTAQNTSTIMMKVLDAQMQVIQFVKAPSLLGMVLDNMIATLHQTLRESSSEKEKLNIRETMSLMIQNLIFVSDAQLHYAIDKNKQDAKQLLCTAGDMLAKSVSSVASLAVGPRAMAGVIVKNIFSSEEMQNGFFGTMIGWIMDKQQIEKRKIDFNTSLRNLFDTFGRYSGIIGPSIQIHGMLSRYKKELIMTYTDSAYNNVYKQFSIDANNLLGAIAEKKTESYKLLEIQLAPLGISTTKIASVISGLIGRNVKEECKSSFNQEYLSNIYQVFDKEKTKYTENIESYKKLMADLSFVKITAKKEFEQQIEDAELEFRFCEKILQKLDYYISHAAKIEEEIQIYANGLSDIAEKYSIDCTPTSDKEVSSNDGNRQAFDKMFEIALSDGTISDAEKDILRPYATAAGISDGEFELMIINKINVK